MVFGPVNESVRHTPFLEEKDSVFVMIFKEID
jgi:hypothetical protein